MEHTDQQVQALYLLAKSGAWDNILAAFKASEALAATCSRYRRPASGWTFLHQAAYFGQEPAARALIALGASLGARSSEGKTPADVAKARGHHAVAELLLKAARSGKDLWEPSPRPELLPSSFAYAEHTARRASRALRVAYGGGVVAIPAGATYYVDTFERVLVGWHGTYDPPCDMAGGHYIRDSSDGP
jgi:hypothetical protein